MLAGRKAVTAEEPEAAGGRQCRELSPFWRPRQPDAALRLFFKSDDPGGIVTHTNEHGVLAPPVTHLGTEGCKRNEDTVFW